MRIPCASSRGRWLDLCLRQGSVSVGRASENELGDRVGWPGPSGGGELGRRRLPPLHQQ